MKYVYAFIGGLWGLLLACFITFYLIATLGGFTWIFVVGDSPSAAQGRAGAVVFWGGLIVASLIGMGIFIAGIVIGYRHGKRAEGGLSPRKPWLLLCVTVGVYAVVIVSVMSRLQHQQDDERLGVEQETTFCRLYENRNRIGSVAVETRDAHTDFIVTIDGAKSGNHTLHMQIEDNLYHADLFSSEQTIFIPGETHQTRLTVQADTLKNAYKTLVLKNSAAKVRVKEDFTAHFRLQPVLSPEEQKAVPSFIPDCALGESTNGVSPLTLEDRTSIRFPVSLDINF